MTVTAVQIAQAKKHGLINVEALAKACDSYRIPFYFACTILDKETDGRNIFGHDKGGAFSGPSSVNIEVTEARFKEFKRLVLPNFPKTTGGKTSNGVGPMQITWKGYFPDAEKQGFKLWIPADNIMFGVQILARNWRANGGSIYKTAKAYNGGAAYGTHAVLLAKTWKKRVGTADLEPAKPAPETATEPVQPAPEVPVEAPSLKPQRGSVDEWVLVNARGVISTETKKRSGLYWVTTRTLNMYLEAGRLFLQAGGKEVPQITQGGRGSIGASAGTHDLEALDFSTKSLTGKLTRLWELCLWIVGFAAWSRVEIPKVWVKHTHAVPKGGKLSGSRSKRTGARGQVRDFEEGKNGLKGHATYPRITATGLAFRTWEEYLAGFGVSLSALTEAFDKRTKHDDVADVQWALSRHLGRDVLGDRDPGPQTKAALAEVGPLDAATLTKLGLEVRA